ncbi:hypothetical protein [Fibrobacter sp. UBA4309]|uniref:hypothetical protein n=1 Tax=Fibrobacter sp. UBA4309 TaxID=1946537 RepID=UPI0025C61B08|nr:hypothetical protein [Fibrobacter sp. UBA4309]
MKLFNKKSVFFTAMAILFMAILLVVFREFAFDSNQLMLNSDQLNGLGSRILRAENVVLTEWDDSRLGGVPTIDALFADAYHPLVAMQFITDPARAVGIKFILTIWVAFMSAMLLAWNLTGNRWWAALLGFLYAFSPEYFTYIYGGHDGKMMVFAIAPLAILAIRKIVREASIAYMVVLALSIAWMILGSHLQLTYMFLWGAGFYTLYEVAFHCDALKTRGKRIGLAAAGLAFGLALSCFQVIPPYLYTTTQSVRGEDDHTNYGHASSWCLHQEELMQMVLPGFIGVDVYQQDEKTGDLNSSSFVNIDMQEYRAMKESGAQGSPFYWGHNSFKLDHNNAGALLTFLGFLCLFLPGKRRWACFWAIGAVVALSYGMGVHSPLFKLWYNILPGAKSFRAPGMSMFWLPLILVMMAAPVIKALADDSAEAVKTHRALLHGSAMFAVMLLLAVVARYNWTLFIGPFGLVVSILFAVACLAMMSIDDQGKPFSAANFVDALKNKLPGTPRGVQICVLVGFAFIGLFLMSGQNFLTDPIVAPYFKPLDEITMNSTAGKAVPGFLMILAIMAAALAVFKWKGNVAAKAGILAAIAGIELFFINGIFIQNVAEKDYIQPQNPVTAAIQNAYKADAPNFPRVLSLSRSPALSGNTFPQYHMRNAAGIHDNELASYRKFRGGQQNENYMMNLQSADAPHPFLDLMNVGAIIFDSRQGTTFMPIQTAMGEAYIYGEAVVMDDDQAIQTLRDKAAIRKEEPVSEPVADTLATDSTATDATATDSTVAATPASKAEVNDPNAFYYREKVILSEAPEHPGEGGVANGYAKLVESPKMDTQVFQVESDRAGFMVVAGNYHPYWTATVNGAPAKVYKAFGTLRAVEIPKGKSEVRMEYRSAPLHACLKVSFAAAILLLGIGIFAFVRRRRAA